MEQKNMKRLLKEKQIGKVCENKIIISPTIYVQIPSNYPFNCPTMYIRDVDHVRILTQRFSKYKLFIEKYKFNIPCFCCSTLTCNWSPCNTCCDLYEEYIKYNQRLKEMAAAKTYFTSSTFDDLVLFNIAQFL
jgi:hypothetical protein